MHKSDVNEELISLKRRKLIILIPVEVIRSLVWLILQWDLFFVKDLSSLRWHLSDSIQNNWILLLHFRIFEWFWWIYWRKLQIIIQSMEILLVYLCERREWSISFPSHLSFVSSFRSPRFHFKYENLLFFV